MLGHRLRRWPNIKSTWDDPCPARIFFGLRKVTKYHQTDRQIDILLTEKKVNTDLFA